VCPECKAKVAEWRGVARELNTWKIEVRPSQARFRPVLLRWAAAALLMLGLGVVAGRVSSPSIDPRAVRAAIEPAIRRELRAEFAQLLREQLRKSSMETLAASSTQTRELLGDFAKAYEQNRAEDAQALYSELARMDTQRLTDLASLKRDLDTVAVFSDTGFRQTQRQLLNLASYTQPAGRPGD
jgi:hypothetical protein